MRIWLLEIFIQKIFFDDMDVVKTSTSDIRYPQITICRSFPYDKRVLQVSKPKRINCWVMKFRLWIKLCNSFDYSLELDIQLDLHICVYNLCVQFVCTIGITHLCVLVKNRFFFKKMGQTRPHFVYFRSFHMTNIAQIQKWKKCRLCTWDSNPGQQNGRHRWIHWAMAAPHN